MTSKDKYIYTDPDAVVSATTDISEDTEVKEIVCSAEFECLEPED